MFELDVTAGDGIANHNQIRARFQVFRIKWLGYRNSQVVEKIRHGRIGGCVRTGDMKAALLEHTRKRGHGGATDTDQMNVLTGFHVRHEPMPPEFLNSPTLHPPPVLPERRRVA